jgi:hypothetical protein
MFKILVGLNGCVAHPVRMLSQRGNILTYGHGDQRFKMAIINVLSNRASIGYGLNSKKSTYGWKIKQPVDEQRNFLN